MLPQNGQGCPAIRLAFGSLAPFMHFFVPCHTAIQQGYDRLVELRAAEVHVEVAGVPTVEALRTAHRERAGSFPFWPTVAFVGYRDQWTFPVLGRPLKTGDGSAGPRTPTQRITGR